MIIRASLEINISPSGNAAGISIRAGSPVRLLPPNKRDTAMVFQSYALLPHYNIFGNVAYGLKLRKMDKNVIKGIE